MLSPCFSERVVAKLANVELRKKQMHDYQLKKAVPFLRDNPFSALFIDMGLGKTICSLTVIAEMIDEFVLDDDEKILVIAPLKVATDTWPTEIGLWGHTAHLDYKVIHVFDDDEELQKRKTDFSRTLSAKGVTGAIRQSRINRWETREKMRMREELCRSSEKIHIISRDWVRWLVDFYKQDWPYRVVFIDESSGFKDHNSSRFKALKEVRTYKRKQLITRLHELTATPCPETIEHLFSQIYLLDLGERLGRCITHFRRDYLRENRYTRKWEPLPGSEKEVLEKIADLCLVLKAEDYLDVKEPIRSTFKVSLPPTAKRLYEQMQTDFLVKLPNGAEVEAESAAALSQKLLQMASGVLYETYFDEDVDTDDMKKVKRVHHIHDAKIDALKEVVEAAASNPLLVAYHFKSSLDRLKRAFPKAVVMDKEGRCIKQWNAGKIPILLVHPQSAGHGLNMQKGGHNLVFFDLPWSYENYFQLIGRLARQGQKHVVVVQHLIAEGTLDSVVYKALCDKKDGQDRMFAWLKRLIDARLKNAA